MKITAAPSRSAPLARLPHDVSGAAAVEFGLVAIPFLALLGATVQIALLTWAQQNLDFTFQRAARMVFTGQSQTANAGSGANAAAMLTLICDDKCGPTSLDGASTVYNCSGVKIDLKLGTSFAGTAFPSPIDPATRTWATGFGTNQICAPPGSIVIATAAFAFPLHLRLWNAGLSSFADGDVPLQPTAVFRTERYTAAGNSPC